jgi:hypothetical protein
VTASSEFLSARAGEGNYIVVLVLAWTYVLSARWAELIPGACISKGETLDTDVTHQEDANLPNSVIVNVGEVEGSALEWWRAVLLAHGSWNASIRTNTGATLCSPWSVKIQNSFRFTVVAEKKLPDCESNWKPLTFDTAMDYLMAYCHLHGLERQCELAFAAALLIPVAKYDNRKILLPVSQTPHPGERSLGTAQPNPFIRRNVKCLDQLLTLSCNAKGLKSILISAFFEQDVECNIYGAWLQGLFAFLDSEKARDRSRLLYTLVRRDPNLAILWVGAFITGADARCFQEARSGWWKVDLSASAWTETLASFV